MAGHVLELNSTNFKSTIESGETPVLVDFWAPWCRPCQMLAPVVEEVAAEFAGKALVAKVNVDENPDLATQHGIRAIPSLVLFRGGQVRGQITGLVPKAAIAQLIQKNL